MVYVPNLSSSGIKEIIPSDSVDIPQPGTMTLGIEPETDGTLSVLMLDGDTILLYPVKAGVVSPIRPLRINATGSSLDGTAGQRLFLHYVV